MLKRITHQLLLLRRFYFQNNPQSYPLQDEYHEIIKPQFDLSEFYESLRKSELNAETVAEVEYKNHPYPIIKLEHNPPEAKKKLLIIAGVHGNETSPLISVQRLLKDIQNSPEYYENCAISILAPANPVGVEYFSRLNENGLDINRDFRHYRTVGARVQMQVIEKFKPDVIISLHEGPQKGFFMISEGRLSDSVKQALKNGLKGEKLASKSFFRTKLQSGLWEKPKIIYVLQKIFNINTLGSYAHSRSITMITTESGWNDKDLEKRISPHLKIIKAIVNTN